MYGVWYKSGASLNRPLSTIIGCFYYGKELGREGGEEGGYLLL